MKYIAQLLAILFFSSTALAANPAFFYSLHGPFSGVYGSVAAGYEIGDSKNNSATTLFVPFAFNSMFSSTQHATDNSYIGSLMMGYSGILNDRLLVGLEGRFNFENLNMHFSSISNELNSSLAYTIDTPVKLQNDFGLLLKLGAVFEKNTLFYILVGPEWGNFKVSSTTSYFQNIGTIITANINTNRSFTQLGSLLGAGIESLITDNVSVAIECTHNNYGTLNFPRSVSSVISLDGIPTPGTLFVDQNKINTKTNNVLLKLNYYIS